MAEHQNLDSDYGEEPTHSITGHSTRTIKSKMKLQDTQLLNSYDQWSSRLQLVTRDQQDVSSKQ